MSRIYLPSYSKLVAVGDKIDFNDVGNLPAVIDVSRCREVTFRNCKFADGQVLQLGDGIKANFELYNEIDGVKISYVSADQTLLEISKNNDLAIVHCPAIGSTEDGKGAITSFTATLKYDGKTEL